YGHDAGDLILTETARRLTSSTRGQDIVSRWGGEEFLILLPETAIEGGCVVAEKIRLNIARPFLWEGKTLSLTMSIGVAAFEEGSSIDDWIRRSDVSLYKAKRAGRNRVEWVLPEETLPC
ncbi:MAG: GGDEF domain-containing protein, partial [Deltaproteobacteria bacterium]|nr:GGDEF domain-containing protein [Deltaproteobacteria bacterium]